MDSKQALKNIADVPNKFYTSGGTFTGNVSFNSGKKLITSNNYGVSGFLADGNDDYMMYMGVDNRIKLSFNSRPIDVQGELTMGASKKLITSNNYGVSGYLSNGGSDYMIHMGTDDRVKIGWGSRPVDFVPGEVKIQGNQIWHRGNFTPDSYVRKTGDTMTGGLTVQGGVIRAKGNMHLGESEVGMWGDNGSICTNTFWSQKVDTGNISVRENCEIRNLLKINGAAMWGNQHGIGTTNMHADESMNCNEITVRGGKIHLGNIDINNTNGKLSATHINAYEQLSCQQLRVDGKRITVSQSAPGGPATGDVWISW